MKKIGDKNDTPYTGNLTSFWFLWLVGVLGKGGTHGAESPP